MKKGVLLSLSLLLFVVIFSGCKKAIESETSVLYVDRKGAVLSLDVEELNQEYYDLTELENFVQDAVKEYTKENGEGSVKIEDLTLVEGNAKLRIKYKTIKDYEKFVGIELYQGKVGSSAVSGYPFDVDFVKVQDGKSVASATKQDILADENLMVVVTKAKVDLKIDGEICYASATNVKITGKGTVSMRGDVDESTDEYTYIVYK